MIGTTRAPERRRIFLIDLPEEILSEILILLPPKCIIRCRAVCKALRRVASDRGFLLAHHRRQPPRRLLTFVRDLGDYPDDMDLVDYCVESLDLRSYEFRSVVRFTTNDYDYVRDDNPLIIHAACDGLLLMSFRKLLYLCNPTTRQWVPIVRPALKHDTVMGLYAHGSSSEYRVLYFQRSHQELLFFISTVGSEIGRSICPGLSSVSMKKWLGKRPEAAHLNEPFLINGNLHWLPCIGKQGNILVFDTQNEIFSWLHVPFEIHLVASFLEVQGTLAMSNSHMGASEVDVWHLLDYKRAEWAHKYRVELPVLDILCFEDRDWCANVVSQEGDVLVDGLDWQLHYDSKECRRMEVYLHHLSSGGCRAGCGSKHSSADYLCLQVISSSLGFVSSNYEKQASTLCLLPYQAFVRVMIHALMIACVTLLKTAVLLLIVAI